MLLALAEALQSRDAYSGAHSLRVAALAGTVGERLGWDEARLTRLRVGALLHDIGKLAIPKRILRKPGPLTSTELERIRLHPVAGARLVSALAPDHLVGELGRPGVAAEVGGADPLRDRLQARLPDRATDLLGALVRVGEERRAGKDHRHRVRHVLPEERRRGAVRRLGHHGARDEVLVEGDEERLRAGDRAEQRQDEVGEDVAVAVQRRDDERRAGRGDEEGEGGVDELRLVGDLRMPRGGGVHLLLQHPLVRRADRVLRPAEDLRAGALREAERVLGDGVADPPLDPLRPQRHLVVALALAPLLRAVRVADGHAHDRDRRVHAAERDDPRDAPPGADDHLAADLLAAVAVRLLNLTWFRVGSERYARESNTYGVTTLAKRHVTVRGNRVMFRFVAKHRVQVRTGLVDTEIAGTLKELVALPGGRRLFRYQLEEELHNLTNRKLNEYIQRYMGEEFTAKDFRTWGGTLEAAIAFGELGGPPEGAAAQKQAVAAVMRRVGGRLGNTPAVTRASYVSPAVVEQYLDGRTIEDFRPRHLRIVGARDIGLDVEEQALLSLLCSWRIRRTRVAA